MPTFAPTIHIADTGGSRLSVRGHWDVWRREPQSARCAIARLNIAGASWGSANALAQDLQPMLLEGPWNMSSPRDYMRTFTITAQTNTG